MPDTDVNGDEPVSDSPATVQTAKGRSEDEPEPGKRYIVGLDSSAPRRDRAKASRDAKLLISQLGGTVRLESRIDTANPFFVFEAGNREQALTIASATSGAKGEYSLVTHLCASRKAIR
jgi:hypothetical protein